MATGTKYKGNGSVTTGSGNDDIQDNGSGVIINAGDGNNRIQVGDGSDNVIIAGSGDDDIHTGNGNNTTINAGDGNNHIDVGDGMGNHITTGSGDDAIHAGKGDDVISSGAGNDHIHTGSGNSTIDGGSGDDTIQADGGTDTAIYHGNFADFTLSVKDNGDATVAGSTPATLAANGTDTLRGVDILQFDDMQVTLDGKGVVHYSDKTIDQLAVQQATDPHPGTMWFGTGNAPTNYNITDLNNQGVELGLKMHVRGGSDYLPASVDADGTAHYNVAAGTQSATRAAWNFDFAVDTGFNGSHGTLDGFDFKIVITQETTAHVTHSETFTLDPTTHVWSNAAQTAGFSGDDQVPAPIDAQVAENSVNLGFLASTFGPLTSSTLAGTHYDIVLEMLDSHNHHVLGAVHDSILLV